MFARLIPVILLAAALAAPGIAPALALDAEGSIQELLRNTDLGGATVSATVLDVETGRFLVEINADEPVIPASNMKLVTTAAAVDLLGPDFVFETELALVSAEDFHGEGFAPEKPQPPALVIRGSGDPALGDPKLLKKHLKLHADELLDRWVAAVVATGVKRFDAVVVDDRVFDREFVHPSWPRNQLNRWYCAEVAGINFYDNCLDISPEPTQRGLSPRVSVFPAAPFVETSNQAKTGKDDSFWISRPPTRNHFTFHGSVRNAPRQPFSVTVHDPPVFLGKLLQSRLARQGVSVQRVVRPHDGDAPLPGRALHVVRTTLPLVLQRTNQDSQNLFAEALLKRLGHQVTGTPGSFDNGAAALRIYMREALGPRAAAVSVADGSGMSRDNMVTTRLLTQLLRHMHHSPHAGVYRESLAYAGKNADGQKFGAGTIQRRFSKLDNGSWVFGKSGYIREVSSLSGYLVIPKHPGAAPGAAGGGEYKVVAFSFICNGFKPPLSNRSMKALQDAMLERVETSLAPRHASAR